MKNNSSTSVLSEGRLVGASLLYLSLPYVPFAWGWTQWWVAIFLSVLLLIVGWELIQDQLGKTAKVSLQVSGTDLMICAALAVFWLMYSGVGGAGLQNHDYIKHNAVLHDLASSPWPVTYDSGLRLIYSFAYYLPAALVGKAMGWSAAQAAIWIWSLIGVWLTLVWVRVLADWRLTFFLLLIFIFLGGLDYFGFYWFNGWLARLGDHIEWWASFAQYSANMTLLIWVPQHAIGGWLASAVIVYSLWKNCYRKWVGFIIGLSALWSPFAGAGLVLLTLVGIAVEKKIDRKFFHWSAVCGLVLAAFVGGFLFHNVYKNEAGMSWTYVPFEQNFMRYILFFPLEIGLFAGLVWWLTHKQMTASEKTWLKYLLIVLFFLPLYKFGAANDLAMRASIPLLFATWMILLRRIPSIKWAWSGANIALVVVIVFSMITGFEEWVRSYRNYQWAHVKEGDVKKVPGIDFGEQYLGRVPNPESVFSKLYK